MSSFAAVTILALACLAMANAELYPAQFQNWAVEHGKTYADDAAYQAALSAFSGHEDTIRNHPADASYKIGHNSYSDMTWSEFRSTMKLGQPMPKSFKGLRGRVGNKVFECEGKCAEDIPDAVDWTTQGAVTEVKDQGQCGSCWSFSTTGSLEGAFFLAGNDLTEFSEQMLVDCDNNGDMGCNGGLMDNAFQWIESNGGICTEQDYPYTAVGGTCQSSDCTIVAGSAPTTYTDIKQKSLSSMEAAVALAPVSIAIQADQPAFQLYTSGVMDGQCGHQLDHGVLAVGYGTDADSGEDFWKIKNSWGASWGEDGYIRISKGEAGRNGQCGILDCGSYPSV